MLLLLLQIAQLLQPCGYTSEDAGTAGGILIGFGLVGAAIIGPVAPTHTHTTTTTTALAHTHAHTHSCVPMSTRTLTLSRTLILVCTHARTMPAS